ncbi:MAG: DEAD/DEAH box helicase, partial [Bacteroidota bacterium]
VIIDEATQCDIASCLPLIQRAKRVVFAGDPNQLRHVSFLSNCLQAVFQKNHQLHDMERNMLNYRDNSVLDLVMHALKSSDQVAMLDEHYRSIVPIIAFSNRQFYDDGLRIMTSRPDSKEQGLYLKQCKGTRKKEGYNVEEASHILSNIRSLIDSEVALDAVHSKSIGIISPFRDQTEYIGKCLFENFSVEEITKHKLRVGTAYGFQGEERDIMHLSFAVDANTHHSAYQHINKADVFNVSITRARYEQHIYVSVTKDDLQGASLLRTYLESINSNVTLETDDSSMHDQFLEEVAEQLATWEMSFWRSYQIAGLYIDLLIKRGSHYIGIDLVGYPGEMTDFFGLERYRILQRAGVRVFPLPYSDWYFEKEETGKALKGFINRFGSDASN